MANTQRAVCAPNRTDGCSWYACPCERLGVAVVVAVAVAVAVVVVERKMRLAGGVRSPAHLAWAAPLRPPPPPQHTTTNYHKPPLLPHYHHFSPFVVADARLHRFDSSSLEVQSLVTDFCVTFFTGRICPCTGRPGDAIVLSHRGVRASIYPLRQCHCTALRVARPFSGHPRCLCSCCNLRWRLIRRRVENLHSNRLRLQP
jgi:hypothetical protein